MASWLLRVRAALVLLAFSAGAAAADDLAGFNAALEDVSAHNRVAIGYLRTDNRDLAELELQRMRASWAALSERYGKDRPAAFRDNPLYVETLVDVPTRMVGASLMLTMGRPELARVSLQAIRISLSKLRRAGGVDVLADCILDANMAMEPIAGWEDNPPDLAEPAVAADVAAKSSAIGAVVKRCDAMAPPETQASPEFRRLIDGVANSLSFIATAVATRDNAMLHRVVGELRAFDNLLAFRYG